MIAPDVDAILRAQGADPARVRARSPRLVAVAERAWREGAPLLAPAVTARRLRVERRTHGAIRFDGGERLSAPLVADVCAAATEIAVIVVTIGAALEDASAAVMPHDPAFALALDGLGTAAVEALANEEKARLAGEMSALGSAAGAALSPGMEGWPLDAGQREIFALLRDRALAVRLLESGMMHPRKSLSFIVGLGPAMDASASHCDYCSSRDRCRHRRAS